MACRPDIKLIFSFDHNVVCAVTSHASFFLGAAEDEIRIARNQAAGDDMFISSQAGRLSDLARSFGEGHNGFLNHVADSKNKKRHRDLSSVPFSCGQLTN